MSVYADLAPVTASSSVPGAPAPRRRSVLDRVSVLLDCFDRDTPSLSLTELCERTGLPKSTVYRFAEQLVRLGWFERPSDGYAIGVGLSVIGDLAQRHSRLRWVATPRLQRLAVSTQRAVQLSLLDGDRVEYLETLTSPRFRPPYGEGDRVPVLATGAGRTMLAHRPSAELEVALGAPRVRRTPFTIVGEAELRRELGRVIQTGFCLERDEVARGVTSVSAAVIERGRAIAAVTVCARSIPFDGVRIGEQVRQCAAAISADLRAPRARAVLGVVGPAGSAAAQAAVTDERHIA